MYTGSPGSLVARQARYNAPTMPGTGTTQAGETVQLKRSRKRATITGAPNFGYDLVVRKTTPAERAALDLTCFRKAVCGAEHVRPDTVRRFAEAFAQRMADRYG